MKKLIFLTIFLILLYLVSLPIRAKILTNSAEKMVQKIFIDINNLNYQASDIPNQLFLNYKSLEKITEGISKIKDNFGELSKINSSSCILHRKQNNIFSSNTFALCTISAQYLKGIVYSEITLNLGSNNTWKCIMIQLNKGDINGYNN